MIEEEPAMQAKLAFTLFLLLLALLHLTSIRKPAKSKSINIEKSFLRVIILIKI